MFRRHIHTTLIAGLLAGLAGMAVLASPAHARKRARAPRAEAARSQDRQDRASDKAAAATEKTSERSAPDPVQSEPAQPEPAAARAPAPAKARVYTFSGLDVNGNLKAPQLLFFRGRLQQELDTSNPEKRSFLKELERTADAKGL